MATKKEMPYLLTYLLTYPGRVSAITIRVTL